jgi:hypothetical protein
MQRGIHAVTLALVALLLACIACWAAVAQYVAAGLAVCAVAVFLLEVSLRLRRLEIGGQDRDRAVARLEALRWLLDAVLVALLAAGMAGSWPERLFPAAILLGLVNLLPLLSARRWIAPVEDRVSQSLILSIAAMAGYLLPALQLITLLLLGLSLIAARRRDRLTPA